MAFKINIVDTILPLGVLAGVGYFAITYGPSLMDTVYTSIMTAMGQSPVSGGSATAVVSGATATTCTTGNPQMDQMITSMGMDLCQYTGGGSGTMGAGGLGAINQGLPNAYGQAWQNMGGIPGVQQGTIPPSYGTAAGGYPQFTGAPQFQATPLGSAQVTCPNGICRSYVGETINGV